MNRINQRGQAVLIVLLTMVVALTVVLSIVSSSSSDIKLSTTENSSQRAFSAAEAGAEKALIAGIGGNGSVNSANYTAIISGLGENLNEFAYPSTLANGESGIFWLVEHAGDKSLTCTTNCFTGKRVRVCWGGAGTPSQDQTTPAMEVSVFYLSTPGNYSTARVAKNIIDPNILRGGGFYDTPNFTNCTIAGTNLAFGAYLKFSDLGIDSSVTTAQNGLQFITFKPLYNTGVSIPFGINVSGGANTDLPAQGHVVDSSGSLNNATRRVEVTKTYGGIPAPFDASVFSGGDL